MAWSDKLKLSKQTVRALTETGYLSPKEIQLKTLTRINGGQDVIAIGPEQCGKTTTYVLAVLNRFKYTADGVPKVLILVPDKDHVLEVINRFEFFNKNASVSIVGLYPAPGTESQMNALADGADIVVATPERARAIYLKLGLNLNKIELLIVDDAEVIVKQGLQLPVAELANSIVKCQHLVFTTVLHNKLDKIIAQFMKMPAIVEVEEDTDVKVKTFTQLLYQVPNFGTKLNLLRMFMQDDEVFTKTVVFVNSRSAAEKVYRSLQNRDKNTVAILNSPSIEFSGLKTINEFIASADARILIVNNENVKSFELGDIPFLIHFELPEEKETFINRVILDHSDENSETLAITFTTDLELPMVKKIEHYIGQKIPVGELPDDLVIEKDKKDTVSMERKTPKTKAAVPVVGEAFHQKKPENSKTYNYSSGQKAKNEQEKEVWLEGY